MRPRPELDAWFRAHSHADAVNGPPPASSSTRRDRASVRRVAGHALRPRHKPVGECGGETERALRGFARGLVHRGGAHAHRRVALFGFGEAAGSSCAPETAPTSVETSTARCARERLFRRAGARVRRGVRAVALVRGQQAVRRRGAHTTVSARVSVFFGDFGCGTFSKAARQGHFFRPQENAPRRRRRGLTRERRVKFFGDCAAGFFPSFCVFLSDRDPVTLARSEKVRAEGHARPNARTDPDALRPFLPSQTFRVCVPRAHAETTRDAPDRDHRQMMRERVSGRPSSDDGDERVANASAADGEFEATPMEAAARCFSASTRRPA